MATAPDSRLPEDVLYEVVDGQAREKTLLGAYEAMIASVLAQVLGPFCHTHRLGRVVNEMLFRIDVAQNLQRRPDVAFVSSERWPYSKRVPKEEFWDVVPDLVVEIVSPSKTAVEVRRKIHEFFDAGVLRFWVIYPDTCELYDYVSSHSVRILQDGDELDGGLLFPGFRVTIRSLLERGTE